MSIYQAGDLTHIYSFAHQGVGLPFYEFDALHGMILYVDTVIDSPPSPNNCSQTIRTGKCNLRSAYYACQAGYSQSKNLPVKSSSPFVCNILLPKNTIIWIIQKNAYYGDLYNTSLSVDLDIVYRDRVHLDRELASVRCCFTCKIHNIPMKCSYAFIGDVQSPAFYTNTQIPSLHPTVAPTYSPVT